MLSDTMPSKADQRGSLTLLFTSVGRRIELLQAFRAAARRLKVALRIVAVDSDVSAPGLACADEPIVLPRVAESGYVPGIMDAVVRHKVNALIPTTDTELPVISEQRDALDAAGCRALVADPRAVAVCRDKLETYRFLVTSGIDTPKTYTPEEIRVTPAPPFPLFSKPLRGSASQRVHKIEDQLDLDYNLRRYGDLIIQEFVAGQEYTLDVYVGLDGAVRCVVPRARWQVRTGEVSKGVVVKDLEIMHAGKHVVETLGGSPRGVITLQCIVTPQRRICFIEINPRFGGGAPMGIAAGADYPAWIIQELLGQRPDIAFDGFRHGLCMLRYDWSVFLPLADDLTPGLAPPLRKWPRFE
jgi:carbamoyl-phosphate synthase large subunit